MTNNNSNPFVLFLFCFLALSTFKIQDVSGDGILYPQDSETRQVKSLDGIWNFRLAPRNNPDQGFTDEWALQPLDQTGEVELMPVPSSYNDITQSKAVRDHVGWAWYDRQFFVPSDWTEEKNRRVFLRFGSAHYNSIVYVNGEKVVEHSGGALPFFAELSSQQLNFRRANRLTVAINNTLTRETVPQGKTVWQNSARYPEGYFTLDYSFDFFNYAGIHRSVFLYSTPREDYIDDIDVFPGINGTTGLVTYAVKVRSASGGEAGGKLSVALVDDEGTVVASNANGEGELVVPNAKLWWPITMVAKDSDAGYLYTLVATLSNPLEPDSDPIDVYRLKVGIRSVGWTDREFLINGKPFYFRGFGRHEDSNVRGRGVDNVMLVKDHNLVKWTGSNSYRTSHYPYSEEIMDLTDRLGIVIIDEVAAVALDDYNSGLLTNHKAQMAELIQRDKNRASVVMWSVSNEPQSGFKEDSREAAEVYFKEVFEYTRQIDPTKRPVTFVTNIQAQADNDVVAQFVDILCINRYYSWYYDAGHLETIAEAVIIDVENWVKKYPRPLIVAEYGSDTVAGLHMSPSFVFTEEYQTELMREYFKAFDYLRRNSTLIGEHIWNFADFMTKQEITRITGNRKGIFTRDRNPKASAHLLRQRYHLLAAETDAYPIPEEINEIMPIYSHYKKPDGYHQHDEH